jgi:hypothetical protein
LDDGVARHLGLGQRDRHIQTLPFSQHAFAAASGVGAVADREGETGDYDLAIVSWPQSSDARVSAPLKTQSGPPLPLQQLTQILLPDGCVVEGEMAARLRRDRQQNEARVWHPTGLLLGDAQLGRIDEIIG